MYMYVCVYGGNVYLEKINGQRSLFDSRNIGDTSYVGRPESRTYLGIRACVWVLKNYYRLIIIWWCVSRIQNGICIYFRP